VRRAVGTVAQAPPHSGRRRSCGATLYVAAVHGRGGLARTVRTRLPWLRGVARRVAGWLPSST
jgi:hypothetical protein